MSLDERIFFQEVLNVNMLKKNLWSSWKSQKAKFWQLNHCRFCERKHETEKVSSIPSLFFFILYSNKENNKLAIKQLWDKHSDGILLLQVSLASISNNIHPMDHNFNNFALNGSFLSIVVVGFLKFEYKKQANSSGEGNCIFEDIIYLRNDQYKLVSL